MKNTIMKMNGNNQVLATVANGAEGIPTFMSNGALPIYTDYDYNYSYPSNDLIITNGSVINNNSLPAYGYDNITAYSGHFMPNDYSVQENTLAINVADKVIGIGLFLYSNFSLEDFFVSFVPE